jgi:hypothetical protein
MLASPAKCRGKAVTNGVLRFGGCLTAAADEVLGLNSAQQPQVRPILEVAYLT